MAAFVHVNLKVLDAGAQARLAPLFKQALEAAGGRIVHFGPVVESLEGEMPRPMAGIFEFASVAEAIAFYASEAYAEIKAMRRVAQDAQMFIVDAG